jgi:hypothetical protein
MIRDGGIDFEVETGHTTGGWITVITIAGTPYEVFTYREPSGYNVPEEEAQTWALRQFARRLNRLLQAEDEE